MSVTDKLPLDDAILALEQIFITLEEVNAAKFQEFGNHVSKMPPDNTPNFVRHFATTLVVMENMYDSHQMGMLNEYWRDIKKRRLASRPESQQQQRQRNHTFRRIQWFYKFFHMHHVMVKKYFRDVLMGLINFHICERQLSVAEQTSSNANIGREWEYFRC